MGFEDYEPLRPQGTGAILLGFAILFLPLTFVVVVLRFYVRITMSTWGLEDWLMLAAYIDNLAQTAIIILGTFSGIGAHDDRLTAGREEMCALVTVLWQMTYVTTTPLIKCSILITLTRIAIQKQYLYPLYALFVASAVLGAASFFIATFQCDPVAAAWTGEGRCLSEGVIIAFSYAISSVNVAIDWATAVIPIFLVWNMNMASRLKRATAGVLGLGIFASVATIVRMKYCAVYALDAEVYEGVGNLLLWAVFECNMGMLAGLLPMLRKLLNSVVGSSGKTGPSGQNLDDHAPSTDIDLVTIGRLRGRHKFDAQINTNITLGTVNDESSNTDRAKCTAVGVRGSRQLAGKLDRFEKQRRPATATGRVCGTWSM